MWKAKKARLPERRPEKGEAGSIDWLDRAAMLGSLACMAHCLGLPLIVAALPALSSVLSLPESFHIWMLAFAAPAAAIALVQGRARHGATYPLWVGGAGLALLALAVLAFRESLAETLVTVSGSLFLVSAHVANWRLRQTCAGKVI